MQVSKTPIKLLDEKTRGCYVPKRFIVAFLGFLGMVNTYALRANLGVAMVAMVNSTTVVVKNDTHYTEECPELKRDEDEMQVTMIPQAEQYNWDARTQGLLMSSFFYAYFLTVMTGGYCAEKFGAQRIYGAGVCLTSVLTLLTPIAVRWGTVPFIIVRALEGMGEGVTYPAMTTVVSRWSPKLERSRISSAVFSGSSVGTVLSLSVSGLLCNSEFFGGWPSVFYIFGALGCIWFMFWSYFIYETPDIHPTISEEELLLFYQTEEDQIARKKSNVPWKQIFTSVPMWGLLCGHIGSYFGLSVLMMEFPTYLNAILLFNVGESGLLTGLPNLLEALGGIMASYVADKLIASQKLSVTAVRKIFNSIALYGSGLFLLGVAASGCHATLAIVLYSFLLYVNGFKLSGYNVTHVDMCPPLAGTLYGMTNSLASLTGIIAPNIVGAITASGATRANWNKVFYITAGVYFTMGTLYAVFASAKLQDWDTDIPKKEKNNT